MEIKRITDKVSVSPQITAADVADIKKAGFRAIICNRPDGEGADQPSFEELRRPRRKWALAQSTFQSNPGWSLMITLPNSVPS